MTLPERTPLHERETLVEGMALSDIQQAGSAAERDVPAGGLALARPPLDRDAVAAVIPAYQAESWVGSVAAATAAEVGTVLVVDDGSTDNTAEAAGRASSEVQVLRHRGNQGKGAALRTGFRAALADASILAVVTLDADGQHVPSEIGKLLERARDTDLVLGSRSHLFGDMFWLRRVANRLSARGISLAAGCSLCDVQTGFRLYRRRLLERLPMAEDRFEAESAVVVRAARRGFRIRSVDVELAEVDGRATSHYRPLADSGRIALGVLAARLLGSVTEAGLMGDRGSGEEAKASSAGVASSGGSDD